MSTVAIAAALALSVASFAFLIVGAGRARGAGCPNEQLRHESNINPATHEPYDLNLPECRAYEMVSPLGKQDHDAISLNAPPRIVVASAGSAIAWVGQGAYAEADNYEVHASKPTNPYVASRDADGWTTRSAYPPMNLIEESFQAVGGTDVYSENLAAADCGFPVLHGALGGTEILCSLSSSPGGWKSTEPYSELQGEDISAGTIVGASADDEDIFFRTAPGHALLPTDVASGDTLCRGAGACGGIYELAGLGTSGSELRLVDVESGGNMIGPESGSELGALPSAAGEATGTSYHAVSSNGSRVFFTATPQGGVPTIYARIGDGETVTISDTTPSECTTCNATAEPAIFQGASANGNKVFFATTQQLLNSDTDTTSDLYEYDFANPTGHKLVQVSGGGLGDITPGVGAEVSGVAAISEDGSHIFFVAGGVLTSLPNSLGQTAEVGGDNLYGYDTETTEIKFVARLAATDKQLWGLPEAIPHTNSVADPRLAQTTPDGRYLVFDSYQQLINGGIEADTSGQQQVYRYDFLTGRLVRVSLGHEGSADNGNAAGYNAVIAPAPFEVGLGTSTVSDTNRAISENGGDVAFVTAAPLQSSDAVHIEDEACDLVLDAGGAGCQVYLWRECPEATCTNGAAGEVTMISDGRDPAGVVYAGMSASGADIFFQTRTQLVSQDTDELGDIYDARLGGGFLAPTSEPSCSGEECQGEPTAGQTFTTPTSSTIDPSGNVTSASGQTEPAATVAVKIIAHSSRAVSVAAPAAGSLGLSGSGLATAKKVATKAGTYSLGLALTKSERTLATRRGHVIVTVRVKFVPTGGGASSQATTKITIRGARS